MKEVRTDASASEEWKRYGRAVIQSMLQVLDGSHQETHGPLLETADYWLSVGLAIGLSQPKSAKRLLALIEAQEGERARLEEDAAAFCAEVLG